MQGSTKAEDFENIKSHGQNFRLRRCIVSREVRPIEELIRFVLAPDGHVTPDIFCKLPGRGMWVIAKRDTLQAAIKKGVFLRGSDGAAKIPHDLLDRTEALFKVKSLNSISIARRAGAAVFGGDKIRKHIMSGAAAHLLIACNAGKDIANRMTMLAHAYKVDVHLSGLTSEDIGSRSGRPRSVCVSLARGKPMETILHDVQHWEAVSGFQDIGLKDSDHDSATLQPSRAQALNATTIYEPVR